MSELIPRRVLFGNARYLSPLVSPDGCLLAYVAPHEGVLNVWVRTIGQTDDRVVTADQSRGISQYCWAQNGEQILFLQDEGGDENYHLFAISLAPGATAVDLTPIEGVAVSPERTSRRYPDEIAVCMNDRDSQLFDIVRVNTRTGERSRVAENPGAAGWVVDDALEARCVLAVTPADGRTLLYRDGPGVEWRKVAEWGADDALTSTPLAIAPDGRSIYMISSVGTNTSELRILDPDSGEEEVLVSDPVASVAGLDIDPNRHHVRAAALLSARTKWSVLDPGIEADYQALASLQEGDFEVLGTDDADQIWLVAYTRDRGGIAYYCYDRRQGRGEFLFSARPDLEGLPLAGMAPVHYEASDGLRIHGYLSLPDEENARNLPTVLLVHGGPWWRDQWGYNPEAQWLTNRGYACLQVNFRGSTGYGKDFLNAGDREWGGAMQQDLTDAVGWLVSEGIADPERVGIYGGSYGGYAALVGMTMTPDLYACGVAMVGPSNLITFIESIPPYWEVFRGQLHRRVGNPETDREFLESRSPLFHVDQIRRPLMIAQGANDPRVKRAESIQIRDALIESGRDVNYMEFADEGHGFQRPENRLKFYGEAERFLAEHLGGRCEED